MIELTCLDGSATAALSDQLVAVYRAAMGAAPFHETAVETGWFAEELAGELTEAGYRCWVASDRDRVVGFAYGFPTAEVPSEGWYAVLRQAVRPDAAGRVRLFLSEHRGDARPDTLVHLRPDAVETIAAEFGATVEQAPWAREVELRDPDGNRLRIGAPTG